MAETAALLADAVLPDKPLRLWVLSPPFALRFLLTIGSHALNYVLAIVYRTISGHILKRVRLTHTAATPAP